MISLCFFFPLFRLLLWKYLVKHTASLYLKLLLRPAFFIAFLLFLKRKVFDYFKLIYFLISRSTFTVEKSEGGIFSKAPDWQPLFLLKMKLKRNPDCPNQECNSILKHIYQNIRTYPRKKKQICRDQWLGKGYCILGRILAQRSIGEQV